MIFMRYLWQYESPLGQLGLVETKGALSHILFAGEALTGEEAWETKATPLIKQTAQALDEYFAGKRKTFAIPLYVQGTPFQQKVWQALQAIPYGATCRYMDIAAQVGSPKAMRAVGMANHNNTIPIIIPCHRVIGANGKLTGYAGGLHIKQYLLDLEQKYHD